MYDISVPIFTRFLSNLSAILAKAEAHAEERKIDPDVFINYRLYPDMLPFKRQVMIACDHAKGATARLAGVVVPSFEDTEKTFADLQARIAKTQAFMATLAPDQFRESASRTITLKIGGNEMSFPAQAYLLGFAMPNFHFHLTTAYNILRHNGVELGKGDYMGRR